MGAPGETCDRMFFVKSGHLRYNQEKERDADNHDCDDIVGSTLYVSDQEWICEACLWTAWNHTGVMHADGMCSLIILDADKFQDVARKSRMANFQPARYGELFVMHLNTLDPTDLTDLQCPTFDVEDALMQSSFLNGENSSPSGRMLSPGGLVVDVPRF